MLLTDPFRRMHVEGRPYAVLDRRPPEQPALIFDHSRNTLNGWLVIDSGGNRPDFDIEVSKHVDLTIIPFRASEEDIHIVALVAILVAQVWPSAWPANTLVINAAQYLMDGLGKAFPRRWGRRQPRCAKPRAKPLKRSRIISTRIVSRKRRPL